jgi:sugar phosphate isomerase/epimerase
MSNIAFITANMVGRFSGYRFQLKNWMEQDRLTRQKTDEKEWASICAEISAAGYTAVEIWAAHLDGLTQARAKIYRRVLDDNNLRPIGLAGTLTDENARACKLLGIPVCNGGYWGSDPVAVKHLTESTGVKFNYENHPEKTAEEIIAQVDNGGPNIGIALDTGYLGTHGIDAPEAVRKMGKRIRHVHLKDVGAVGGHETVPLGTGIVNIIGLIAALKEIGYTGWYSWEDEPENRNPMEIASEMRCWIEEHL